VCCAFDAAFAKLLWPLALLFAGSRCGGFESVDNAQFAEHIRPHSVDPLNYDGVPPVDTQCKQFVVVVQQAGGDVAAPDGIGDRQPLSVVPVDVVARVAVNDAATYGVRE